MILGLGTDIVPLARFSMFLDRTRMRARERLFTPTEWDYAMARGHPERSVAALAARFAAKEACAKALGTGIGNHAAFQEIGVVNMPSGQPTLVLTGHAARTLAALTPSGMTARMWVSLSDEAEYAHATVIIEGLT